MIDPRHHLRNRRAARNEHDGLVLDDFRDRDGLRGIGLGGLNAAPGGAGAPADDGLGALGDVLNLLQEGFPAGNAVDAVFVQGHVPFDGEDVVAVELPDGVFESGFGLMTGRGHDRVVVVERDHGENEVLRHRMVGADEGLGAARAFETVEPNHGRTGFRLHGFGNFFGAGAAESETRGRERTKLQEAASADALTPQCLILRFKHGGSPLGVFRRLHRKRRGRRLSLSSLGAERKIGKSPMDLERCGETGFLSVTTTMPC